MADNIQRTKGRGAGYKFDRGGTPAEFGPYIGKIMNNVDPTRSGRLQVYIEQFGGSNPNDKSLWRTVSYVPPFYGVTPHTGTNVGTGTFTGNQQSYGMWFTPPDIGVRVICIFVAGDPNQGYYIGCVPEEGITHMVPAIGSSKKFQLSDSQKALLGSAKQLPVTEINNTNLKISENPRFFDQPKPVHSVVAAEMLQQGLINDTIRGPINSNSQRESPSNAYGITTPGRPIYQGGLAESDIKQKLQSGAVKPQDLKIIARRGGHSIVMDDGDLEGKDNLVRIRTSKGHQITMSDDGNCFYIVHANGQTWIELGVEGTVDVYATNSVNVRTQGTINLHADKDVNIYAKENFNVKAGTIKIEGDKSFDLLSTSAIKMYSKADIGITADGSLVLKNGSSGGWDAGDSLVLVAGTIDLNGGTAPSPPENPKPFTEYELPDTSFSSSGWTSTPGKLKTIVTRAPTHEPWSAHNTGVSADISFDGEGGDAGGGDAGGTATDIAGGDAGGTTTDIAGGGSIETPAQMTVTETNDQLISNPINSADFLTQAPAEISLGSLDKSQVTGLLASAAGSTGLKLDSIDPTKGIGKYGLSPKQLESSGFLKPGTVQQYLSDPAKLQSVLASPTVWTGKGGVGNLSKLLSSDKIQNMAQQELMTGALAGLKLSGLATGKENPAQLAALVQSTTKFGIDATKAWSSGNAPAAIASEFNNLAKSASQAASFVTAKAGELGAVGQQAINAVGTVKRAGLDKALTSILGDPKIPTPGFGG